MRQPAQGRLLPRRPAGALRRLSAALALAVVVALGVLSPGAASAAPGDITTVAGNGGIGYSGDGGPATAAAMSAPSGVAVSGSDLFVADFFNHTVRRIDAGGTITTLAGTGVSGYSGDGGPGTSAMLAEPGDVVLDAAGNTYIADFLNSRIRRVTPGGIITTFAGTGSFGYTGDGGPALFAQLANPAGLDIDTAGNLYVSDFGNHTVRRITPAGIISTVAGNGTSGYSGDGGPATSAQMNEPGDVKVDGAGNVFIPEFAGHRVRKVTAGTISTVAGTGLPGYSGNGGPATSAQMSRPAGVDMDSTGNLFVAEFGNHVIRRINPGGTITLVAGTAAAGFSGDGGPALSAQLDSPSRVKLNSGGDFYISDWNNHRVRRVEALGSPAAPTLTSTSPASPSPSNNPNIQGTALAGSTVRLYTNSTCTSAVAATGTAAQLASPGLSVAVPADSATTFWATATDGSGTVSGCTTSSITYVEDSTPPAVPTIDSAPPSPDNDSTPSWSFSGEVGATFECRLVKGALVVSDWTTCSDPQAYVLSDGDGTYTFQLRQTDEAGNLGPTTSGDYELDTAAPSPPSIVLTPASPGSDASPTWGFIGEASALFECRLTRGATVISDWSGCLAPRTYDLSGEPDGSYTFSVRQTDLAGNVSGAATNVYVLDTATAAAPTIDSGPPPVDNDPTPTWSFTGEPGASFDCRLEAAAGQPVAGYDWASCSSPKTYDLTSLPDGPYTFLVRQTDPVGNTSPPTTRGYVLDTTAPAAPTIDASPPAQGSATNPAWSFSGEPTATFECRVDRGATVVSNWASCSSPHALDLSVEPDGLYTFSVRAVDAVGNLSATTSADYGLDRMAPPAPTLTGTPGALGNDETPAWSFTGEAGALLECRLERGGIVVADWQLCTNPATYDLAADPDGSYRFLVRATDSAGNVSPPTEASYVLDRIPPAAPSIDSDPGPLGNSRTPAWSFTGDAGAVHECRLTRDGQVIADWAACAGTSAYDLAGEPDGVYVFAVRGRDQAGNVGLAATSAYQLDTTGSNVTIESGPQALGSASNPGWSFTAEPGASLECRLDGADGVVFDWAACTSPHTYDLSQIPDGAYTFRVRAQDEAGNVGEPVSYSYELDRVAPAIPVFTLTPRALDNDTSPSWEFTAEPGALLSCALGHEGALGAWEPCAGGRTYDLAAAGDGSYALQVRAADGADNVSPTAQSTYQLDATAPDAPLITGDPGARGTRRSLSWTFSGEPQAAFECRLTRGTKPLDGWGPCSSPSRFDLSGSSPGNHTFSVRASDAVGNLGPAARSNYELLQVREDSDAPGAEKRERTGGGGGPTGDPDSAPAEPAPAEPAPAQPAPANDLSPDPGVSPLPGLSADGGHPARRRRDGANAGVLIEPPDGDEPGPGRVADRPATDTKSLGERLLDALGAAAAWVGRNLDKTAFPLLLLLLVVGYLALQNRFDRRDPKLALAPVHADSTLEFLPPPSLRQGVGPSPPPYPSP